MIFHCVGVCNAVPLMKPKQSAYSDIFSVSVML